VAGEGDLQMLVLAVAALIIIIDLDPPLTRSGSSPSGSRPGGDGGRQMSALAVVSSSNMATVTMLTMRHAPRHQHDGEGVPRRRYLSYRPVTRQPMIQNSRSRRFSSKVRKA
jgi:hypothetical protein